MAELSGGLRISRRVILAAAAAGSLGVKAATGSGMQAAAPGRRDGGAAGGGSEMDATQVMWFEQAAATFRSSFPLGNGRIGAMVFGGVEAERIVLNESSVWSGSRQEADRPDAWKVLPEIRRLLLEGKNIEAEALVDANFTCQGKGSGACPGGELAVRVLPGVGEHAPEVRGFGGDDGIPPAARPEHGRGAGRVSAWGCGVRQGALCFRAGRGVRVEADGGCAGVGQF